MNNKIGKPERASQNRVLQLFQSIGYVYLGDWEDEVRLQPVEENILKDYLLSQGYSEVLIQKAIDKLVSVTTNLSGGLYETNKEVYHLIDYGVTVREDLGTQGNGLVNRLERY